MQMNQVIAGRYQIMAEIGSGGMGTIYQGMDLQHNHLVAIKHLKSELSKPETIQRFMREGEMLRSLNHPNIVKMLDAVEQDGDHYLILEYFPDGDLAELLKRNKLSIEYILKIAIDLCDALTQIHHLNIIHRDL